MSLGVRYDTTDPVVIQQFHPAFDFWTKVLDADFHDEQSTSCAIAVVDGTKEVLRQNSGTVARAQLLDWRSVTVKTPSLVVAPPKVARRLATKRSQSFGAT
jgi:hypothetical protein